MKIVAIIQARMGSTRLPGKIMLNLYGETVLSRVVKRVQMAKGIDSIVIATTLLPHDDILIDETLKLGALAYRGSEEDVLSRYFEAAVKYKADVIIRITSDCPLIEPELISEMLDFFHKHPCDYLSNTIHRTYPRGLDVEVFTIDSLAEAMQNAGHIDQREHVTPYIYQNPNRYHIKQFINAIDYSKHRWTLDTPEDWELIHSIYKNLYSNNESFGWLEVLRLFDGNSELFNINAFIEQKKLNS
ncbi:spore coat polysaccharide biosynthesis protein SpsF [Paenibacillus sp. 1_12]|uniref:cytidylyltransferase domain-containing protein n=1 Tax=Paenibacillus sp. 1_12 TaxID=1566278 RepID=UPI0008E51DD9|nr:glycosyltransferase family protein [Paenibacillus sp. 1_12]SFL89552.1 spore coat polysaccharide biosynthesis protein SpsF [Paenibacillus sp. 1_12]